MAIVNQTARSSTTVEGFEALLNARLEAMLRSQQLVTEAGGRPVNILEVAGPALTPFGLGRFDFDPELAKVTVDGDIAIGLALLLHELATNAVKYGALSNAKGRIGLTRLPRGVGLGALEWRERGGPPVKPSNRRGFGSRLLELALRNRGGKVESAFEPQGFSATLEFPIER
jgi:two-component sensor histidine kinase